MACTQPTAPTSQQLADAIARGVTAPAKFSVDGRSGETRPLSEQIAAHRYLRTLDASRSRTRGLCFKRAIPPGAA